MIRQARLVLGRAVRWPLTWAGLAWLAVNLWWLRTNRWTPYAELDEAGYARFAISLQRQATLSDKWRVLSLEGFHGPLQALLAYVPMKLTAGDLRVLIALNLILTVVAAFATADLAASLAGRRAGVVAGALVLVLPGVVGFSRNALTATLPMAFMAVTLAALARSRGLELSRWSIAAGVGAGCMLGGRSMAIGFLPAVAVAGLGWAWSTRARVLLVVRNGLLLVASTALSIGWWWVVRWPGVGDYLFKGGSSDTDRVADPLGKTQAHLSELEVQMGWAFVCGLLVVFVLVLIRWVGSLRNNAGRVKLPDIIHDEAAVIEGRSMAVAPASPVTSPRAAAWPLVASVAAGLLTLGLSTAFGVGFVLPLIPATVAVCVATAHKVLSDRAPFAWPTWAGAVLILSLLSVLAIPDRGMDAGMVWCGPGQAAVRPYCAIHDNAAGAAWRRVNDRVADRIVVAGVALAEDRPNQNLAVAMTRRDLGLSDNMVSLSLEVRHHFGFNPSEFFVPGRTVEQQLDDVVARADLVIAIQDFGREVVLSMHSPTPDQVLAATRQAGFLPCEKYETPDHRSVTVLRAPDLSAGACVALMPSS